MCARGVRCRSRERLACGKAARAAPVSGGGSGRTRACVRMFLQPQCTAELTNWRSCWNLNLSARDGERGAPGAPAPIAAVTRSGPRRSAAGPVAAPADPGRWQDSALIMTAAIANWGGGRPRVLGRAGDL